MSRSKSWLVFSLCLLAIPGFAFLGASAETLPELSTEQLADAIQAAEQAIQSLHCEATAHYLTRYDTKWKDEYASDPLAALAAPWESAKCFEEIEWAFVGSPWTGLLKRSSSTVSIGLDEIDGRHVFHGHYGYSVDEVVYDGEYEITFLALSKRYDSPEEAAAQRQVTPGLGRIRSERRMEDEYASILQTYSFWLAMKPLSQCLREGTATFVGVDTVEGRQVYCVDVTEPVPNLLLKRLWLDPQRGFAIVKRQLINTEATDEHGRIYNRIMAESARVELAEWAPSIWFPKKVVQVSPWTKEVMMLVVEEARFNEELDKETFTITFPPGTTVYDEREGIEYMTGWGSEDLRAKVAETANAIEIEIAQGP
ncbi:MAG: hypothetical protein J7M08_10335 [Planctomycetes bacterium]|nr:hypothetical protein [Planctomycetota bacterium]